MIYKKDSYVAGNMCDSKLELAAVDLETGRIRKADSVGFTKDMAHENESSGLEFTRFPKEDAAKIETITVRSTSLDYCYHTNNIEYVRFILDTYDSEFYKKYEPAGMEIHYLGQSFEGEKLDIEKLSLEDGDLFRIRRDGEEITACKFSWQL